MLVCWKEVRILSHEYEIRGVLMKKKIADSGVEEKVGIFRKSRASEIFEFSEFVTLRNGKFCDLRGNSACCLRFEAIARRRGLARGRMLLPSAVASSLREGSNA